MIGGGGGAPWIRTYTKVAGLDLLHHRRSKEGRTLLNGCLRGSCVSETQYTRKNSYFKIPAT